MVERRQARRRGWRRLLRIAATVEKSAAQPLDGAVQRKSPPSTKAVHARSSCTPNRTPQLDHAPSLGATTHDDLLERAARIHERHHRLWGAGRVNW